VFHGASHWSSTNYFYPYTSTLSYNDGYFIYGIIYSIFRSISINPLLSGELVNVTVRIAGFFFLYGAACRLLHFNWGWALLAAVLFSISCGSYVQMFHAQLLTVCFAPGMALLLQKTLQALQQESKRSFFLWGSATVIAYAAWLMTAFYMAWFFALFLVLFTFAWLLLSPRHRTKALFAELTRCKLPALLLLLLAALVDLPFFQLYLPAAALTGMHSYASAFAYSPSVLDIINVGDRNLLFGGLNAFLRTHLRPDFPLHNEQTSGFPLIILSLFGLAALSLCRHRDMLLRSLALTVCLTWVLFLHVRGYSLYRYVYDIVPGAPAVRAIARYQLFLAAPLILVTLAFLARHGRWLGRPVVAIVSLLLVAEQLDSDQIARINRPFELARLAKIPAPPAECAAFYISRDRGDNYANPAIDGIYSHSVDAMLIAEIIRLPTINGFASFLPPHYQLFYPDRPDYSDRIRLYSEQNHVAGLCSLDLRDMRWQTSL